MDNMELTLTIEEEPQATLNLGVAEGATDEASARTAEAYAKGTRNGVPVKEGDPAYHNNAKYYRDSAAAIAAGDVIDDDAGAGDYNLTWSADKLTSQKADIDALEDGKADAIEVTDSTPASVMTFSDGADGMPMSATFEIAPVQDLHGYANPWPGGAGKNLLNPSAVTNGIRIGSSGQDTEDADYYTSEYIPVVVGESYTKNSPTVDAYHRWAIYDSSKAFARAVGSSNTITIASGEAFARMCGLKTELSTTQVEKGSSATSYAPYENLCPITGWTGCKPSRTGKNLCDNTFTEGTYIYSTTGELLPNTSHKITGYMKVSAGKKYTVSGTNIHVREPGNTNAAGVKIGWYKKDKKYISASDADTTNPSLTSQAPSNAFYAVVQVGMGASNVMFEECETASAYEAFGETYDISFPAGAGTVYGGTLTVNKDGTGKLVDGRGIVDLGSLNWEVSSDNVSFISKTAISGIKIPGNQSVVGRIICENYKTVGNDSLANGCISIPPSGKLKVYDSTYQLDTSAFKTAMNGVHAVYEKTTPTEYTLTATEVGQILSLLGTNNLFCDTGDVLSVDYSADTKLYVDGKISEGMKLIALLLTANHENGMKASKAYASGDLLTVGNTLYKATTSIANGATLTAGTNVTETTIETELAALA